MSDQNRFDEYKQKLLHWWRLFLDACGRLWETTKTKAGVALTDLRGKGKIWLRKLAAWTLKARESLIRIWTRARREGKKLLQKLAAWVLRVREKVQPMLRRAGEWLAAVPARFRASRADAKEALPVAEEASVLPEPEPVVEAAAPAREPAAEEAAVEEPAVSAEPEPEAEPVPAKSRITNPYLRKAGALLTEAGDIIGFVFKWLWKLRTVFMAIPVVMTAVKLAMDNLERLPESVGLDIQSTGEFARMITRQEAVFWPLGLTCFCLVLMFFSKKPLLPWVISIFTLVLPWLIWLLNYYA